MMSEEEMEEPSLVQPVTNLLLVVVISTLASSCEVKTFMDQCANKWRNFEALGIIIHHLFIASFYQSFMSFMYSFIKQTRNRF